MHTKVPTENIRVARLYAAAREALDAYEEYVFAVANDATRDGIEVEPAREAWEAADEALRRLAARKGYEQGDYVRLRSTHRPWDGLPGVLGQGIPGDDRYPFSVIFDEPQPQPDFHDGLARRCYTDLDGIADIEP